MQDRLTVNHLDMPTETPAGHFRILYFASAASFTHKESDTFAAPVTAATIFDLLEKSYPGMTQAVLSSCAITLNLEYIDIDSSNSGIRGSDSKTTIRAGDEVAIIPPVSSG